MLILSFPLCLRILTQPPHRTSVIVINMVPSIPSAKIYHLQRPSLEDPWSSLPMMIHSIHQLLQDGRSCLAIRLDHHLHCKQMAMLKARQATRTSISTTMPRRRSSLTNVSVVQELEAHSVIDAKPTSGVCIKSLRKEIPDAFVSITCMTSLEGCLCLHREKMLYQ